MGKKGIKVGISVQITDEFAEKDPSLLKQIIEEAVAKVWDRAERIRKIMDNNPSSRFYGEGRIT